MELPPISQLPWAIGHDRFVAAASAVTGEGACCLFVIDETIPASARSGYAALVIAYARAKLGLQQTLRAGVSPLSEGVDRGIEVARELAVHGAAGEVTVA